MLGLPIPTTANFPPGDWGVLGAWLGRFILSPVTDVVNYLASLFQEVKAYCIIKLFRSAISHMTQLPAFR